MQETWGKLKNGSIFQRPSTETRSWRIRNRDRNNLGKENDLEVFALGNNDFGDVGGNPVVPLVISESVDHTPMDSSNRSKLFTTAHGTRHGWERPESDGRNHVHSVLRELKDKLRRSSRFAENRTSPTLLDFCDAPHTEPVKYDSEGPENQEIADNGGKRGMKPPSSPSYSCEHEDHGGSIANWFSKVARNPRNGSSDLIPARRVRPISTGKTRGGFLGLGRGSQNTLKLGNFFHSIGKDADGSPDRGTLKRIRVQTGKRRLHGVLRKVKSFESGLNANQSSSPFVFRDGSKKADQCSEMLAEVDFLEKSLWDCELMLANLVDRQGKISGKLFLEIENLKQRCASLDRTQEIHYRSVLDLFNENYRILGYVESHFAYLLSLIPKSRPGTASDFMIDILRFMGDNAVSTLLKVIGSATSWYSYFFPRKRNTAR